MEIRIENLEDTEAVRLMPAMYIGDTGARGLHHLVYDVIGNSIDEAMANRCSQVDVKIHEDNSVSLRDDGPGIPAEPHPQYEVSTLEVILTKLHSGGKFDKKAYPVSGGVHGVSLAVVCALSEWFIVISYRDGLIYTQRYEKGKKASEVSTEPIGDNPTGTLIHFKPDTSIFTVSEYERNYLEGHFRELAYLTTKFTINFSDLRELDDMGEPFFTKYYAEGGIKQFVKYFIGSKLPLLTPPQIFYTSGIIENVVVQVALTYTKSYQEVVRGYVNNVNTTKGGTHITGFRRVLTRTLNDFARTLNIIKQNDVKLSGKDVREGIIAVISIKLPNPHFEGHTKIRLGNQEIDGYVSLVVGEPLRNWLYDNHEMGWAIVNKSIMARKARESSRKVTARIAKSGPFQVISSPRKFYPSRSKDPMKKELFLSTFAQIKNNILEIRDNEYQEILILLDLSLSFGSIPNTLDGYEYGRFESENSTDLIKAIGAGVDRDFDLSKCRYRTISILYNDRIDNLIFVTIILNYLMEHMKPLLEDYRIYLNNSIFENKLMVHKPLKPEIPVYYDNFVIKDISIEILITYSFANFTSVQGWINDEAVGDGDHIDALKQLVVNTISKMAMVDKSKSTANFALRDLISVIKVELPDPIFDKNRIFRKAEILEITLESFGTSFINWLKRNPIIFQQKTKSGIS